MDYLHANLSLNYQKSKELGGSQVCQKILMRDLKSFQVVISYHYAKNQIKILKRTKETFYRWLKFRKTP